MPYLIATWILGKIGVVRLSTKAPIQTIQNIFPAREIAQTYFSTSGFKIWATNMNVSSWRGYFVRNAKMFHFYVDLTILEDIG